MDTMCSSCGAYMWKAELYSGCLSVNAKFSTCCMQGKIVLPNISEPPPPLQHLFTDCTPEARDFRSNIRAYNSSLAFASLGVQEDVLPTRGPYMFRIHGSVYHRIGHFFPENGKPPKFSQIYIYDIANEIAHRTAWNSDLHRDLLQKLQAVLHDCNPFVSAYKQAAELLEREENGSALKTNFLESFSSRSSNFADCL